jgi:hypothetical protein
MAAASGLGVLIATAVLALALAGSHRGVSDGGGYGFAAWRLA